MKRLSGVAAVIGGLLWLIKGTAVFLIGVQPPDGANITILTPFFVISGLGILLALLLLGILARQTQTGWSQLLLIMAVGFPLSMGFLGMIGEWMGNDRLIEIPVVLIGAAWIQIGFRLRS